MEPHRDIYIRQTRISGEGTSCLFMRTRRGMCYSESDLCSEKLRAAASLLSTRAWLAWSSPHAQPPHQQQQQQNHQQHPLRHAAGTGCPLLSDFGCNVPAPEAHPANRFMAEWFAARGGSAGPGLRLCSHVGCGRPETRKHEFRRCSVCGAVNYCSRACQALDWKLRHKAECTPVERWVDDDVDGDGDGDGGEHDGVAGLNGDVMEES